MFYFFPDALFLSSLTSPFFALRSDYSPRLFSFFTPQTTFSLPSPPNPAQPVLMRKVPPSRRHLLVLSVPSFRPLPRFFLQCFPPPYLYISLFKLKKGLSLSASSAGLSFPVVLFLLPNPLQREFRPDFSLQDPPVKPRRTILPAYPGAFPLLLILFCSGLPASARQSPPSQTTRSQRGTHCREERRSRFSPPSCVRVSSPRGILFISGW